MAEKYVIPPITSTKLNIEEEKIRLQQTFRNTIGKHMEGKRSLNVLITGTVGVGKSSIANSMIAAMQDAPEARHIEYFLTGLYKGADQMTLGIQRATKFHYYKDDLEMCWPRFIDAAGFENEDNQDTREMLALLVNGYIPINENLQDVKTYLNENNAESLRDKYSTYDESLRIDRIIFVAASDEEVSLMSPLENISHIPLEVSNNVNTLKSSDISYISGRHPTLAMLSYPHWTPQHPMSIPLFGIMTKVDKVDQDQEQMEKFKKRETEFRLLLGLQGSPRYSCCSCYFKDTNTGESMSLKPKIDVPLFKILIQVCSPSITADSEGTPLGNVSKETQTTQTKKPWLSLPSGLTWFTFTLKVLVFAATVFFAWYLQNDISNKDLNGDCTLYANGTELTKICNAHKEHRIVFFIYPSNAHIMMVVACYTLLALIMMLF